MTAAAPVLIAVSGLDRGVGRRKPIAPDDDSLPERARRLNRGKKRVVGQFE
jgi:hypothetical protein